MTHSMSFPHCYHRARDAMASQPDCIVLRCCIHAEEREVHVR
jgi:hypothetical protein